MSFLIPKGPRIGVTGPVRGGRAAWLCISIALRRLGARPVRITPKRPSAEVDGWIISGGADIEPSRSGLGTDWADLSWQSLEHGHRLEGLIFAARRIASKKPTFAPDPARDALEERIVREALEQNKPLLGICRGAQLINTTLGGTLHSTRSFYGEEPELYTVLPRKSVSFEPGTRLFEILGERRLVNALHHQTVDKLSPELCVSGRDERGIVQGIELEDRTRWMLGVQWHPEYMPQRASSKALFRALLDAS